MKIKMYYNKNLKMSPGKLAAQCGHVARELGRMKDATDGESNQIIVLEMSKTKFDEMCERIKGYDHYYIQVDNGRTEVPPNTATVCGFIVEEL